MSALSDVYLFCIAFANLICGSQSYDAVHVANGQKAQLHCRFDIAGDIHTEWSDPGGILLTYDLQVLTQDKRFSVRRPYMMEWILEVLNVRNGDAGNYTCRIGPHPVMEQIVELIVTKPPEITKTSGNGSYQINSTVTLICEARGSPEPKITWHRVNEHYLKVDLNADGRTYVIESLDRSTAGVYECYADNGPWPIAMAALPVDVLFAPIVKVPYREVVQEEGKWTQLSCLITANPVSDCYWKRNGERIKNSSSDCVQMENTFRYQVTLRLTIEQLSASDFGDYKCYAENKYGKDEGHLNLLGQQNKKAVLMSVPRDTIAVVNEDALMNCSVMNLPKGHSFVWWRKTLANETNKLFEAQSLAKASKKVTDRTNRVFDSVKYDIVGQYNLFIRKTNFSDQGIYICQITGHENYSATLNVIADQDPSALCNGQTSSSPLFATLIILAVVVFVLLIVAVIVVVMVYVVLLKRSRKDSSYTVELSSKVKKTGDLG